MTDTAGTPAHMHEAQTTILLNTLPKSGSRFVRRALARGLGRSTVTISGGMFPDKLLVHHGLRDTALGGHVTQDHLPANRYNLLVLEEAFDRMILHLRDPRQSLLSWTHHLNDLHGKGRRLPLEVLEVPAAFVQWSLQGQIDWVIDNHLPLFRDWLAEWVRVLDAGDLGTRILVTRHEDMVSDQASFFRSILDFYDIPHGAFTPPPLPEPGKAHYRKGETDEWRRVFTSEQACRASDLIGNAILNRFGWAPE